MLTRTDGHQMKLYYGTIDDLMPEDHFLRDLDRLVDFSFIYDLVGDLYASTGRPSVDPVVIVKMLLIGYLYGIDSERKLEREIRVNIAYRWFLGFELDDPIPDHTTLSQLRRRKFHCSTLFQDIFDKVVRRCMEEGLVTGKLLLTDSTHIRANARNDLREIIEVTDEPTEYMKKLDQEAYKSGLIKEPVTYDTEKTREITQSVTDPESGLLHRPGKPNAFCYLDHQTCDAENGIITDVYVTPGNVHDAVPHTGRLEYQIDKFDFPTEAICADASYDSGEVYNAMMKRKIKALIPTREFPQAGAKFSEGFDRTAFSYDCTKDVYICPAGKEMYYFSYSKSNRRKKYHTSRGTCMNCPYRQQCIGDSSNARVMERHLHAEAQELQRRNVGTELYEHALRLRKIWCEGNFSHQKEEHNLRRTRMRGIEKVTEQCLLSACALNLKRFVRCMKKAAV